MLKHYLFNLLLISFLSTIIISGKNNKLLLKKTFDVSQNQTLKLLADAGDVELVTWNENKLLIQIYGNKKAKRNFDFAFSQNDDGVKLVAEKLRHNWFNIFGSFSLYYKVFVPEKFDITIKTSGGDISISSVSGNIELRSSGGDIKVVKSKGEISSHTSGGDIKIIDCKGSTNAITSGGDVDCKNITGNLIAKTSGGDITIDLKGKNFGVSASTSGGDISVSLPLLIKADIKLHTVGGDINNNLKNVSIEKVSSSKFYGKLNGGGNLINCKTSGGDISINNQ